MKHRKDTLQLGNTFIRGNSPQCAEVSYFDKFRGTDRPSRIAKQALDRACHFNPVLSRLCLLITAGDAAAQDLFYPLCGKTAIGTRKPSNTFNGAEADH
ncbi:MAG: hypothetical protein EB060_11725 [Proteobacteria bacterium]|nr:hypothetical protein [Pseudomonadota bacterium]